MPVFRKCTVCGLRWQVGRIIPVRGGKYECPQCERKRLAKEARERARAKEAKAGEET